MVVGLAFAATAVASLFAQSMLVRWTRTRRPQHRAWAVALAMFALASVALASGASTGWDRGTYRVFYLFGAVLDVPWLALGTVYLLARPVVARRAEWVLVLASGFAAGVVLAAPMRPVHGTAIPVGRDVFGALPRVLAGIGSGLGATVIVVGAVVSAVRAGRGRAPGRTRLATANALIAVGVLVLASGGLLQGVAGHDEAFALTLTAGIVVVYAGSALAGTARVAARVEVPGAGPTTVGTATPVTPST
jgi:hypothetical protein